MTSSHFLGKPSLPEMVIIISLSLTARMKWFPCHLSSNEASNPTSKESNQALARSVRVWGKKLHKVGSSHWPLHPAPMKMFMWSSGSDEPLYFPTLNGNFVVVTRACAIRGVNLEFSATAFGL
ncbi:hypothetical protein Hanom_Chr03g00253111 [Helianthus anomalus]